MDRIEIIGRGTGGVKYQQTYDFLESVGLMPEFRSVANLRLSRATRLLDEKERKDIIITLLNELWREVVDLPQDRGLLARTMHRYLQEELTRAGGTPLFTKKELGDRLAQNYGLKRRPRSR